MLRILTYLLLLALIGCTDQPAEIRIGVLLDEAVAYNEDSIAGARMLAQDINRRGGQLINGKKYKIRLYIRDCGPFGKQAINVARELILQNNISILLGPNSTRTTQLIKPMLDKYKVLTFNIGSTLPSITSGTDHIYRMTYSDTDAVNKMVNFSVENLQAKRPAVLYDKINPFTRYFAEEFSKRYRQFTDTKVLKIEYLTGERDFKSQLAAIKRQQSDLLVLPGFTTDVQIQLRQAKSISLDIPVMATDALEIDRVQGKLEFYGVYALQLIHGSSLLRNKKGRTLYEKFLKRFNRPVSVGAILSIDSLQIILDVMTKAKSQQVTEMQKILKGDYFYDGYAGRFQFDNKGESNLPPRLYRIDQQGITEVELPR